VRETKPYAGERAAPDRKNQDPDIKPFNNNFVPSVKPIPEPPQTNHARKVPLQATDNNPASIISAPNLQYAQKLQTAPSTRSVKPLQFVGGVGNASPTGLNQNQKSPKDMKPITPPGVNPGYAAPGQVGIQNYTHSSQPNFQQHR
jgi:hypothetical protein